MFLGSRAWVSVARNIDIAADPGAQRQSLIKKPHTTLTSWLRGTLIIGINAEGYAPFRLRAEF